MRRQRRGGTIGVETIEPGTFGACSDYPEIHGKRRSYAATYASMNGLEFVDE